jgi:hypothetical protein
MMDKGLDVLLPDPYLFQLVNNAKINIMPTVIILGSSNAIPL